MANQDVIQPPELEDGDSSSLETTDAPAVYTAAQQITPVPNTQTQPKTKTSFFKRLAIRVNIYLLALIFVLSMAGIIVAMTYFADHEATNTTVPTQTLTDKTLKQLAGTDVTVGEPKQVLSVQSNAVFAGKVLVRDSLDVAGQIRVGGALNIPGITVSGNSVFEDMRINKSLSVAGDSTLQGNVNIQKNLNVAGGANFGGNVSAGQLSANSLQMNGNLNITKHIGVGGSTPGRSNGNALGGGGTVSVSGSDTAGTVNINTGSNPGAGCFVTITFTQRFNATPRVMLTPVGQAAGNIPYYVTRSATDLVVCTSLPAPASSSFSFDYFIIDAI